MGSILNEVTGEDASEKRIFEQRPEGSHPSGERVLQVEEGAHSECLRNKEEAGMARAESGGERGELESEAGKMTPVAWTSSFSQ